MKKSTKTKKQAPVAKRGRPKGHTRDPEIASKVALLKAGGFSVEVIAASVGLAPMTVNRYYANELNKARDIARSENMMAARRAADKGNAAAINMVERLIEKAEIREAQKQFTDEDKPAEEKAEQRAKQVKLGKKEAAQEEAQTAGIGSDWGNDLIPVGFRN